MNQMSPLSRSRAEKKLKAAKQKNKSIGYVPTDSKELFPKTVELEKKGGSKDGSKVGLTKSSIWSIFTGSASKK